jgi:sn-glycerol 3-phosphate transport system permease protein
LTTSTVSARAGRRPTPVSLLSWLMLVPCVVVFALFIVWPLGKSVSLSLHGSDLFGRPDAYVGLQHYRDMLGSPDFRHILGVTFGFVLLTVIPGVLGALLIVLLLEQHIKGIRIFRTAFALPFAFSVASASVIFATIYNPAIGLANGLLGKFGVDRIGWLTDPSWALISVAITTVWMSIGYNVLVLSAGIGAIPTELNEAATLDGAGGWRASRYITIPLLGPQLFFLIVISTIQSLQGFGQIKILTPEGGPEQSTKTLVYSIYHTAFANNASDFGAASAQAIVLFVILLICTAIQFGVLERRVHYK